MIKMKQESLIEELQNIIPVKIGLIGIVVSEDKNQKQELFVAAMHHDAWFFSDQS